MHLLLISSLIIINNLIIFPKISLALNKEGAKFCNFPTPTSTEVRTKIIFVTNNTDFGYKRIIFNGERGTCNPKVERWEQAMIIGDGLTVSNLIMGESPIGTASDIIVEGGGALDGFQKIFVQSGPGKTIIKNFCSVNNAIGIVSCGNCSTQYTRDITIENSKFKGPMVEIISGNRQYNDKLTLRNIQIYGNNNPATKIKKVCTENLGSNAADPWKYSYEPGKAGTSDKFCKYPASAVKIIN
uniref:Probable pectate lyase F n=1 Tax=Meloidogyne hapla TaxID=6305 RepID=A0A1I8BNN6_MELHA